MSADSTDAGREEIRHIRGKIAVQRGPEEFLRRHTRTSSAIRQVTASKSSLAAKKLQDVVIRGGRKRVLVDEWSAKGGLCRLSDGHFFGSLFCSRAQRSSAGPRCELLVQRMPTPQPT